MGGHLFPTLLFALVVLAPPPALAIFRCGANGAITYSDLPCGDAAQSVSLPPAAAADSGQAQQAQRTLARQQDELRRIQLERERREAAEQSARARAEAGRQAHIKRCKLQEMKARWSTEDAARAGERQRPQARRAAQRKAEQFELECAGIQ